MSVVDAGPAGRSALWAKENRPTTVGLVVVVTLVAFEYLGVATALPTLVAQLHGGALYAWPITAFAAASAVGTALAGRISDRRGPGRLLLGAVGLFAAGLLVAGTAGSMTVLLAGRVLQGLGGGAESVAVWVLIAQVYPARDRPVASAVLAGAWVVPSLVGPAVAGVITQQFGWRWVFLGLLPLLLIGLVLLTGVVRRLPPRPADTKPRKRGIVVAALGAAVGVAVLTAAGQRVAVRVSWLDGVSALAGLVVLGLALRRLMPAGTIRARRGMPSVVLARGLLAGSYAAVESFVPLTLTAVHRMSPSLAGLPLTIGALGWSASSAWQGRHRDVPRTRLLRVGLLLVALGVAGMAPVALGGVPGWWALPAWTVAGAGMGLGMPSIAVLQLDQSPVAERGFHSSAVQLADMVATVLLVGLGGALIDAVASTTRPAAALLPFDLVMAVIALIGALVVAGRTRSRPGGLEGG